MARTSSSSGRLLAAVLTASTLSGLAGFFYARERPDVVDTLTNPQFGSPKDYERGIEELRSTLPSEDMVSTNPDDLLAHGWSSHVWHPGLPHTVVVYPTCTEDVVKIVKIAKKYRMPVIPYSGATSLEGHFLGSEYGGICVDMSGMDKIIETHEADSDVVCQPGIGWMDLNETLKSKGIPLFFPLDPAPSATIGGMLSTGCSGTNAVRYGTAKAEWFLNATVVLPSGEVIKTRRRSRKSSAGFDVTKLFIGAEGTLGIVTEVTIRLAPVLPYRVATVQFPDVKHATEAVVEVLNKGVGIQCVELLDRDFMTATNQFGASGRQYPVSDHLFFKLQGPSTNSISETAKIVKEVAERHGGKGWRMAKNDSEGAEMWMDRKMAHYTGMAYGGAGAKGWSTDVCVPISKLPQLIQETHEDIIRSGLKCTMVGHAGDGNFHTLLLFKTEEELKVVREVVHRMVHRAISLDGTCTGEHGVGVGKKEHLYEELGAGTVELMKTIKRTIDPLGLFNPGKLYPDAPGKDPHAEP
ncbi:FAD-binding domain-containing protein [Stereum hirsutum FP-91666 SS1]|uniref:D-lactate dehydrogenase (cytochrome) n=1 Tax=Stereum hirsutum (strain FP-91666) TaxID=721885 RepID=R7RX66_STEHR|nr:FAD-binding domain-containing protein [Stereum hirsutum FP-91666 SS1]EIM79413.1 FAD-binding domain-containing protein [Stereum hirsutum FP-91666 SS1]